MREIINHLHQISLKDLKSFRNHDLYSTEIAGFVTELSKEFAKISTDKDANVLSTKLLSSLQEIFTTNPELFKPELLEKLMIIYDLFPDRTGEELHKVCELYQGIHFLIDNQYQRNQRSKLIDALAEYQTYIEHEMKEELKKTDPVLYEEIFVNEEHILHPDTGQIEKRPLGMQLFNTIECTTPNKDTLIGTQAQTLLDIRKQNPKFALASDKYKAVSELSANLASPKDVYEQMNDFRNTFSLRRHILEKRRDDATNKFLKVVASVFASLTIVGAFFVPLIWRVRGKNLAKKIEHELPRFVA